MIKRKRFGANTSVLVIKKVDTSLIEEKYYVGDNRLFEYQRCKKKKTKNNVNVKQAWPVESEQYCSMVPIFVSF